MWCASLQLDAPQNSCLNMLKKDFLKIYITQQKQQHFGQNTSNKSYTFLSKMVIPWYLKGLENSITCARSGLMVRGATIMSAPWV